MELPRLQLALDDTGVAWKPTEVPGVSWLPLFLGGDKERGDATVLIRMEPGHGYPAHRHRGVEEVLVLRGGYRDDLGEYPAGTYVRYEAGSTHAPVALGDPERPAADDHPACVLYAVARDGVELLKADRPRPPGEAGG